MEYFSGDSGDDMSDSEIKDCEEKCYSELLKGVHLIRNKDGTLRCPFCKGKKKQDYKYKDLLQHASGVGAGKRGVEATGGHRALEKFLKSHLTDAAEPPTPRTVHLEQEAPQRPNAEELIVWPWMGIIVNINRTMVDGKYVGAGNSELKERFAGFHPIQVHALWSYEGHLGKAILEFSKDWKGYNDAISFERSFVENHHSRKEYYGRDPGSELYGWVARSEDYNATSPIGKHLRLKGDLKTVAQINNEDLRKKNKLVEDLHNTIQEKNKYLETSKEKLSKLEYYIVLTDSARQKAEENYRQLEETHRKGASVALECSLNRKTMTVSIKAETDENGEFKVELPSNIFHSADPLNKCSVKPLRSPYDSCSIPSKSAPSSLTLQSESNGVLTYNAGSFSYRHETLPAKCYSGDFVRMMRGRAMAENVDESSKAVQPTPTIPSLPNFPVPTLPNFGIPPLPNIPLPTIPSLPNAPPLPTIPSLPNAPPLPTIPSIPSLPNAPPLPTIPSLPNAPPLPTIPTLPNAPPLTIPTSVPLPNIPTLPPFSVPPFPQIPNFQFPPIPFLTPPPPGH